MMRIFMLLGVVYVLHAQIPSTAGWHVISDTKLGDVCACTKGGFEQVCGVSGWYDCLGVFSWSGGVYDTKRNRLVVWGGGHNAYYGNEFYAFDVDDLTMTRLNDPGLPIASGCQEAIAGGTQANSRHTYDGIEYMPNHDKMFVFSGSLACGPGNFGRDTWMFDFAAMTWERMDPSGPLPQAAPGIMTAFDSSTGLIYLHDRLQFFSYDYTADRYTALGARRSMDLGYHMSATIDPDRRKFVIVGYDRAAGAGRVYTIDIGSGSSYQLQTVTTTGGGAIIGEANLAVEYDPVRDQVVAWNGGDVYSLNLDTRTWTRHAYAGAPPDPSSPGDWNCTFGRFRYAPSIDAFVLVNEYNQDTRIFRFPGSGTAADRGKGIHPALALTAGPNPFNALVAVRCSAPGAVISVHDIHGRTVAGLRAEKGRPAVWDAAGYACGVYIIRASHGNRTVSVPVFYSR